MDPKAPANSFGPVQPSVQQPAQVQGVPAPASPLNQNLNQANTPMSSSKSNKKSAIAVIVILIFIISGLLGSIIFFDQVKSLLTGMPGKDGQQASEPHPTVDPKVTCARFTEVDHALENIEKACILDLSNKNLSTLPPGVVKLTKLQTIVLAGNKFTTIPEELTKIPSLTEIDIANNQVATIPESIKDLKNLSVVDLTGNPVAGNASETEKLSQVKFIITQSP
jgi:Leucine-rich repeat (LRR) protein